MHRILERQIRKFFGETPPSPEWKGFFEAVDLTYKHFDEDRELVSRSLDLTSHELTHRNDILKESERKLSTLIHSIPGVVYRCINDKDWTIEFFSDGCKGLYGYAPEEFVNNKSVTYDSVIHPEDKELVRIGVDNSFKKNEPFFITYRIITASKEEKWVQDKGNKVGVNGKGLEIIEGVVIDITERKKAENAVKKLNDAVSMRLSEVERFNKFSIGRELKMVELKKKIKDLEKQLGDPAIHEDEGRST